MVGKYAPLLYSLPWLPPGFQHEVEALLSCYSQGTWEICFLEFYEDYPLFLFITLGISYSFREGRPSLQQSPFVGPNLDTLSTLTIA